MYEKHQDASKERPPYQDKIDAFDQQRSEVSSKMSQLEKEEPSSERAVELEMLKVRLREINFDQEGVMLQSVDEQLAQLGNAPEDEARRAKLLQEKDGLEMSRENRAERMGGRI